MRVIIVAAFMLFVIVYTQRDWFRALCCVVVFTALTEYPGLPNPLDAKGINHWSVMLAAVLFAWIISRIVRPRPWNIPRGWLIVMGLYLLVESIAMARLCLNIDVFAAHAGQINPGYASYNVRAVLVDMVYSPTRYMLLGFLLFDGARTRRQLLWGLCAVLTAVMIYALVVDKEIPLSGLAGDGMQYRHRISAWTNRHPNDLARVFVAAIWIGFSLWQLKVGTLKLRLTALVAVGFVIIALGHTHSRGGYLAFVFTGLAVALVAGSWRTLAALVVAVAAVMTYAPSITDRILTGVDTTGGAEHDMAEVSGGRDIIWPAAIKGIEDSPLIGHGFRGYIVSPALPWSLETGGGEGHPHNAYLETLLDHGVLAAPGRLAPFLYVLGAGVVLVRRRSDPLLRLMGVTAVAWIAATLTMGISGQHWGFSENLFTFWCVAGLTARAVTLPDRAAQPVHVHSRAQPGPVLARRRNVRVAPVLGRSGPRGFGL